MLSMENNIEMYLGAYLDGQADQSTRQMIEVWLGDARNLPAFYEIIFQFESSHPKINTDAELAFERCKVRLFET